eukprot:CFRG6772T1
MSESKVCVASIPRTCTICSRNIESGEPLLVKSNDSNEEVYCYLHIVGNEENLTTTGFPRLNPHSSVSLAQQMQTQNSSSLPVQISRFQHSTSELQAKAQCRKQKTKKPKNTGKLLKSDYISVQKDHSKILPSTQPPLSSTQPPLSSTQPPLLPRRHCMNLEQHNPARPLSYEGCSPSNLSGVPNLPRSDITLREQTPVRPTPFIAQQSIHSSLQPTINPFSTQHDPLQHVSSYKTVSADCMTGLRGGRAKGADTLDFSSQSQDQQKTTSPLKNLGVNPKSDKFLNKDSSDKCSDNPIPFSPPHSASRVSLSNVDQSQALLEAHLRSQEQEQTPIGLTGLVPYPLQHQLSNQFPLKTLDSPAILPEAARTAVRLPDKQFQSNQRPFLPLSMVSHLNFLTKDELMPSAVLSGDGNGHHGSVDESLQCNNPSFVKDVGKTDCQSDVSGALTSQLLSTVPTVTPFPRDKSSVDREFSGTDESDVSVRTPTMHNALQEGYNNWREYVLSKDIYKDHVKGIKLILKNLGMATTGKKQDLIARLREEAISNRTFKDRMRAQHFMRRRVESHSKSLLRGELEQELVHLCDRGLLEQESHKKLIELCQGLDLRIGGPKTRNIARLRGYLRKHGLVSQVQSSSVTDSAEGSVMNTKQHLHSKLTNVERETTKNYEKQSSYIL